MERGRKVLWAVCVLVLSSCLSAQAGEWKLVYEVPRGGPTGWINQLVIDPTKPNILYAATEGAGFLVSEDGGSSWMPKNEGLTQAEEGTVSGYHIRCLALDPAKPGVMYLGMAAFGVFKSTDSGNTWSPMSNESLGDTYTKVLAIHPAKPDTLYLGTDGGGMYRFNNETNEWDEITEGLRNTYIRALVMDPKDPKVLYVATEGGVWKSTNGGDNWTSATNGITTRYILSLAIDPKNSKVLYAGTDGGGLFKTEDGGDKWVSIGGDIWLAESSTEELTAPGAEEESTLVVSSVVVNPVDPAIVYAANPNGVFRSADGGKTWAKIDAGLTSTVVKSLSVTSTKPVTVYAGTADGKLFAYKEE